MLQVYNNSEEQDDVMMA